MATALRNSPSGWVRAKGCGAAVPTTVDDVNVVEVGAEERRVERTRSCRRERQLATGADAEDPKVAFKLAVDRDVGVDHVVDSVDQKVLEINGLGAVAEREPAALV